MEVLMLCVVTWNNTFFNQQLPSDYSHTYNMEIVIWTSYLKYNRGGLYLAVWNSKGWPSNRDQFCYNTSLVIFQSISSLDDITSSLSNSVHDIAWLTLKQTGLSLIVKAIMAIIIPCSVIHSHPNTPSLLFTIKWLISSVRNNLNHNTDYGYNHIWDYYNYTHNHNLIFWWLISQLFVVLKATMCCTTL